MTALLVAVGAAAGAALRHLTDQWVRARFGPVLPVGTLLVNVAGSFLLGLLAGAAGGGSPAGALLGTGFCGALTTYSTFGLQTVRLLADGHRGHAVLNVVLNVTAGIAAFSAGVSALPYP